MTRHNLNEAIEVMAAPIPKNENKACFASNICMLANSQDQCYHV